MITHNELRVAMRNNGVPAEHESGISALTMGGVEPAIHAKVRDAEDGGYTVSEAVQQGVRKPSGFRFGKKSLAELVGVHPTLVLLAKTALSYSTQDFMIFDGLRTPEEQAINVKNGNSRTMQSKHLKQADGFSHAIDCVPVTTAGIPKWDWNLIYPVAFAVDEAARAMGIDHQIVWGGAWDRRLSDFGGNPDAYRAECQAYQSRHAGDDFIDGPHFELRE